MIKDKLRVSISGFLMVLLIVGCAGHPKFLKPEDIQHIRKLAVVTSLLDEELLILDHSGMKEGQYVGAGPYSGVAGLIIGAIGRGMITSSLGGDPDLLRSAVLDLPIKKLFDENFDKTFSMDFETISPQDVENLGIDKYLEKKSVSGKTIKDYSLLHEKLGADMVLEIHFVYGLAAYAGGVKPSAVVSAYISVVNISQNKLLMKKAISSDSFYREGYTVDEFKSNEAEIFKREIIDAIQGLAHLVASDFGVELSLKQKSYWGTE